MKPGLTVGDIVEAPRVRTVVRLGDLQDEALARDLVEGFLLTADAAHVLDVVLGAIERREGCGFFLQGNFGSGKSHLLAVLARVLGDEAAYGRIAAQLGRSAVPPAAAAVAVSLVDYDARERLEDIVVDALSAHCRARGSPLFAPPDAAALADIRRSIEETRAAELAAFLAEKRVEAGALFAPESAALLGELIARHGLPYRLRPGRKALWDALAERLGGGGLALLIDELSEFLRSKPDDRAFQEDIRFLQFLGERTSTGPYWVLATLQEWIEETGQVRQETFHKIKDRYPVRFRLSGRHVEELITKRLVRKKPGAEAKLAALWDALTEAFGEIGFTAATFAALYPVHPGTLALLDELRPLFSQHRGVVDFIHAQIAGDPLRAIKGMLGAPAATLLTADRIFDHFEVRIRELAACRPLVDTVYRYFAREAERLFPDARTRATALRALKLLILGEMSPREKKPTVRQLARLLADSVTDLDPSANYEYLAGILKHMEREGAYIERAPGPAPVDDVYRVKPQADMLAVLAQKIRDTAERLNFADPRITAELLPLFDGQDLPLARLGPRSAMTVACRWQGTRRRAEVFLWHLAALTAQDLAAARERIESGAADFVLLMGMPLDVFEGDPAAAFAAELPADLPLAFWLPHAPEPAALREHCARLVLRATYREEQTAAARMLEERLDEAIKENIPLIREQIRGLYFRGSLVLPRETIDPSTFGMVEFNELVNRAADRALERRHPRHRSIAPKTEVSLAGRFAELMRHFFIPGLLAPEGSRTLQAVIEGYLKPLGILNKTPQGFALRVDIERSPAVKALCALIAEAPRGRLPYADAERFLRRGPYGMCSEQFALFVLAMLASGSATAWGDDERIPFHTLSETGFRSIRALGAGDLLPEELRERLKNASYLPEDVRRRDLASLSAQDQAWQALKAFGQETLSELADCGQQIKRCRGLPGAETLPFDALDAKSRAVQETVAAIDYRKGAREGLEAFLSREAAAPQFAAMLCQVRAARRFLAADIGRHLQAREYIEGARRVLAGASPPWTAADEALAPLAEALGSREILWDEAAAREARARFEGFLDRYLVAYRAAHDAARGEQRFAPYRAVLATPEHRLLTALGRITALAQEGAPAAWSTELDAALARSCRGVRINELRVAPVCRCGFSGAGEQDLPPPDELRALLRERLRAAIDGVRGGASGGKLRAAAPRLREAGRHEDASFLERLLSIDSGDPDACAALAADWPENAGALLSQSLGEGLTVVTRNIREFTAQVVGKSFTREALGRAFSAWLGDARDLPASAVLRIVEGAAEDELESLPPLFRVRFPELIAKGRAEGIAALQRQVLCASWCRTHDAPPETLTIAPDAAGAFADAAQDLRDRSPEILADWIARTEERLPEGVWEKAAARLGIAGDGDALLAAALRERTFPSFLRYALGRGLDLVLAGATPPELPPEKGEAAGHLARERGLARRAAALAAELLRCIAALERELAAAEARDWERVLGTAMAPAVYSAHALANVASALGIALDPAPAGERLAAACARHERAFAAFMRAPVTADMLRIEHLERHVVDRHREVFNPAQVVRILADGLRYDLWLCLRDEFLPHLGATFRIVEERALWAHLPTTTEVQLAKIKLPGTALFGPRIVTRDAYLQGGHQDAIVKVEYIDELCHGVRGGMPDVYREALAGAAIKLQGLLDALPPRTLVLLFADHGFAENREFDERAKYEQPRYVHGGASLFEVIVPAAVLYRV